MAQENLTALRDAPYNFQGAPLEIQLAAAAERSTAYRPYSSRFPKGPTEKTAVDAAVFTHGSDAPGWCWDLGPWRGEARHMDNCFAGYPAGAFLARFTSRENRGSQVFAHVCPGDQRIPGWGANILPLW